MERGNIDPALLADVKNYLNITWTDEATDNNICGLIAAASVYLDLKAGASQDYTKDGLPRTLLFEYVRYARDAALDVFENNYLNLLIGMRNESVVTAYVESTL